MLLTIGHMITKSAMTPNISVKFYSQFAHKWLLVSCLLFQDLLVVLYKYYDI